MNFGLMIMVTGIFILAILALHVFIGFRLERMQKHKPLVFFSATNLLLFALIRPDGVHAMNKTGLSAVLRFFGIHSGNVGQYETFYTLGSLTLLLAQLIIELRLIYIKRSTSTQ